MIYHITRRRKIQIEDITSTEIRIDTTGYVEEEELPEKITIHTLLQMLEEGIPIPKTLLPSEHARPYKVELIIKLPGIISH